MTAKDKTACYRALVDRRMHQGKHASRKMQEIAELFVKVEDYSPDDIAYYLYTYAEEQRDHELFRRHCLRYDITRLPARRIGDEFIKTAGHFHPRMDVHDESYPEVYQILSGEAVFLLQRNTPQGNAREIIAVDAGVGDIVYIPPEYGHVMINPGDDELINANIVSDDFQSVYGPVRHKKGLALYCTRQDDTGYTFIENPNYTDTPTVQRITAADFRHPLEKLCPPDDCSDIYELFLKHPEAFSFLN